MQRYDEFVEKIVASQEKLRYATIFYPKFPRRTSDIYFISKKHDRLDLIANRYYGDPRYWVIIAKSNNLHAGTLRIPPGIRMRVPYPLNSSDIEEMFRERQQ